MQTQEIKVIKNVKFPLTAEQISDKARAAAQLDNEIEHLETELTKYKTKVKSDIGSKRSRLQEILAMVHEGSEQRPVEVNVVKDFEANKVDYVFEGKVVDTREMTQDDRQPELTSSTNGNEERHGHLVGQE